MPISSDQIAAAMYAQNAMFSGQLAFANQISPVPSPWMGGHNAPYAAAPWGENFAGRTAGMGAIGAQTAMGAASLAAGFGAFGRAGGAVLDPFGSAFSMGARGYAMGGLAGGIGGAALGALPGMLAFKAVDVYGGAFMGGIRDQIGINQGLRQNFQFYGGQGPMGRGFSQQQMGAIGGMFAGTAHADLSTSIGELSKLTAMGAQLGQFNGVRDVQQFAQRFRQMIDTLKTIQTELGGSLTEAMSFMRSAQQSGVFRNVDQFASQMRTAQGTTGMTTDQLFNLSQRGGMMARAMGGRAAQGATGALRMATNLGAAMQAGIFNNEALQDATGATGAEGIQILTERLMANTAQFSRRAMGRYSIFGLSNESGTGLDEAMTARMMAGDLSVGDLSRAAHGNVRRLGRARAINREGLLRGALLEQGGLAGQIGIMSMAMGRFGIDPNSDMASLFLQRRMGMDRPEAELMTSLMRNQRRIAETEQMTRVQSRDEVAMRRDIQATRSLDAFTANLGRSIQDSLHIPEVQRAGRDFVTKLSTISQRVMNHLLGIAESEMTATERNAMTRFSLGRASVADNMRISSMIRAGVGSQRMGDFDPFRQGLFETGRSLGSMFAARGESISGREGLDAALDRVQQARMGIVSSQGDVAGLTRLLGRGDAGAMGLVSRAMFLGEHGDMDLRTLRSAGVTTNAAEAFLAQQGIAVTGGPSSSSLLGRAMGAMGLSSAFQATPVERAAHFLTQGGHIGTAARQRVGRFGSYARDRDMFRVAERMGDVSSSQYQTVLQSQEMRSAIDRIQAGGRTNPDAAREEILRLRTAAASMPEEQRMAWQGALEALEHNVKTMGSVGGEFIGATSRVNINDYINAASGIRQHGDVLSRMGSYRGAGSLFQLSGRTMISAASMGGRRGNSLGGLSAALFQTGQAAEAAMTSDLADLRLTDSAAFDQRMEQMSTAMRTMSPEQREQAAAQMQNVYARAAMNRDLAGRGRGGRRGAMRTAYDIMTAGTGANIEDSHGRRLSSEQVLRRIRSGQGSEELVSQMYSSLREAAGGALSFTQEQYGQQLQDLASRSGNYNRQYRDALAARAESPEMQKAREAVIRQQQAQRDPIAAESRDLLRAIRDHTARINPTSDSPGGITPAEGGGR